jgi:hypothetical protein
MNEVRAYVSGGHVYCRLDHEDRDIDQCFGCSRLKRVDEKSSPPYIVCDVKGVAETAVGDPLFVEWWYQHHRRSR